MGMRSIGLLVLMRRWTTWILITLFSTTSDCSPWQPGDHSVTSFSFSPKLLDMHLQVWTPAESGRYRTVVFASSFGLNTPTSAYSKLMARLASHGLIIVGLSKLNSPDYPKLAAEVAHVITWIETNVNAAIAEYSHSTAVIADTKQLVLMAHSAGNHVMARMLQSEGCGSAPAFVMIDPVDGVDPFGIVK